ncbi:MAG TPA: DNA mismatch repair protein MutS [Candidatus Limiplasma sp.]|nr:DNA mismatch repair protein MutS [Candidatus Limiplasma sp.]HPR78356.1 DNA mismatch repair protein MutS [Candidatus Limiplasma sp.]
MFQSILTDEPLLAGSSISTEPEYFKDLCLDQIVEKITAGKEEFELLPLYYTMLSDEKAVQYRQQIMRDLEDESLRLVLQTFSRQVYVWQGRVATIQKELLDPEIYHRNYLQKGRLLSLYERYCGSVVTLHEALQGLPFRSEGLLSLREYIQQLFQSEAFHQLQNDTVKTRTALQAVQYCMLIRFGTVKVRKYEGEEDHSVEIEKLFTCFKQAEIPKDQFHEAKRDAYAEHVEANILELVKKWYPEVFRQLDEYCERYEHCIDPVLFQFSRETQFYLSYLDYIAPLKGLGLSFCYPELCKNKDSTFAVDCFDLSLAKKLARNNQAIIPNDFSLSARERILIISGPNQGGKTTFARMFGQIHHLAALGCPVPGREARLYIPDQLYTHFEREENIETLNGKLKDDLVRIHDIFKSAGPQSLIIINEILASTSLRDGISIGKKILKRIDALDAYCVWVTFLVELIPESDKAVSMVSTVVPEDPTQRTFKIIRRPADGLSYANHIAKKYDLTYSRIKERIAQ